MNENFEKANFLIKIAKNQVVFTSIYGDSIRVYSL